MKHSMGNGDVVPSYICIGSKAGTEKKAVRLTQEHKNQFQPLTRNVKWKLFLPIVQVNQNDKAATDRFQQFQCHGDRKTQSR